MYSSKLYVCYYCVLSNDNISTLFTTYDPKMLVCSWTINDLSFKVVNAKKWRNTGHTFVLSLLSRFTSESHKILHLLEPTLEWGKFVNRL